MQLNFTPKFIDPQGAGGEPSGSGGISFKAGPEPEDLYIYTPRTILGLNVALATRRPLLISGEPGSGKSRLARNAAAVLGRWYYERVITSRTQASDLLWSFDSLRQLSDAQMPGQTLPARQHYVDPGPVWWAFDPHTAAQRGSNAITNSLVAHDPGVPPSERNATNDAVILLDEIDKADPDLPNDLLEPFEGKTFRVRETGDRVEIQRDVLLVLTTNGERELPPAFLRRCVMLTLEAPTKDWFVEVAACKFGPDGRDLYGPVAEEVMRLRTSARKAGLREPGTGEFLDALKACRQLGIDQSSPVFTELARSTLWKHERDPGASSDP